MGTTLLHQWRRIARWTGFGALVALIIVIPKSQSYVAAVSFVPQANEASRSVLAGLAGQFGVTLPSGGDQTTSPEFYVRLLKSRILLEKIVRDTFVVPELGGKAISFLDLFEIPGKTLALREDNGVKELNKLVSPSSTKATGIVDLYVATPWPSVSTAIAGKFVDGINDFNRRTRQGQASTERKFVESRLAVEASVLRAAEDRLEAFLRNNRQWAGSPDLTFQHDRLQREVLMQQQVFTSLTQSFEEVSIREVRDTPVITVVESPSHPVRPEPRYRAVGVLLGAVLGTMIGALVAFISEALARRRTGMNSDADEFVKALGEFKNELLGRFRRIFRRRPA
jgi:uncharacterized protein involved in exopolysaccharide biosynthesis